MVFQVVIVILQFTVLAYGFALAPHVLKKVTKVLASILTMKQVDIIMYLDDWML